MKDLVRRRFQRGQLIDDGDRWICRFREDVSQDGNIKRIRRMEVLGSKKELPTKRLAQRKLDGILEPINAVGYQPDSGATFRAFADRWQKAIMIHHKPSSRDSSAAIIRCHLLPAFGDMKLRDITLEHVQNFVNKWKLGRKTLRNAITLMQTMWDYAQPWEGVQTTPFARSQRGRPLLVLPPTEKPKTYSYTLEEANAIIAKATAIDPKWGLLFRVAAEGGCRPGELAGLMRRDVGPVISIRQSVYLQELQTPKTSNAIRTFPISRQLARDLAEYIGSAREGLVWTEPDGSPLNMQQVRRTVLDPILDELGIREKIEGLGVEGGFYPFRHMTVTELRRRHVPLATIQKRVGHAAGSLITDMHYVHSVDEDEQAAADMLGELLSPIVEGRLQ